jgi:serine/threonine protein kinase
MARIYIGRSTGIGSFERHVVLKMILPERANDETAVQMFLDEARLAASLNHQNVAQVFEVGEEGGVHFLAMEYVHGQDLRALLAKAGSTGTRVPLELALTVVAGAASGLHHAHERRTSDGTPMGIVHRDVSPSNIMVAYDGAVKLLDFGIAKATSRSVETQSGVIKGKFAYMAPEQCRGRDVDPRSDVFSLGIILYEVTTQHRCFRADSDFDTMHRIVTGDIVKPTRLVQGYPPALEVVVMKALAVDANQRYQSAGLLLEAIEAFSTAARMPLSTMSLGRFMREMFGDVQEPWLTSGRLNQPLAAKEQTISNTNNTSASGPPRVRMPTSSLPPPPASSSSPSIRTPPGSSSSSPSFRTPPPPPPPSRAPTAPPSRPPSSPPVGHEDAPMHLPVDALDPPLRDPRSEEASSDSARRSKPAVPPPQLAASPTTSAEPRVSSPNLAPTPSPTPVPLSSPSSPYYTPVARATGLAGGSQPIPPPQSFSSRSGRTGSGSGSAHNAMRPAPATLIPPRHGYPAAPASGPIASASPISTAPVAPRAERQAPPIVMPRRASRAPYIAAGIVLVVIIVFLLDSIARNEESAPPPALAAKPAAHTSSEPLPPMPPPIPASAKLEPRAASAVGTPVVEDTVATNHGDEVPSAAEPAAPIRQPDPSITIRVVSTPPGADVLLAGASIGATPLAVQIKRATGFAKLTVHRARFQDVTTSIDLATNYESDVTLTAIEEPPPAPIVRPAAVTREPRALPAREPKRPAPAAAPAAASKRCQPVDRFNPFDSSCNGKPCPRCPAP